MENFSKGMENYKKESNSNPRENANRISEMSNSQDGLIIRQDTHEERSNDLKNWSIEIIQTETEREKKISDKN